MVDWLQISQVSGNSGVYTVTVTASSTSELTARTTSLTVTAHAPAGGIWTDKTQTVSIRQKGTGELVVTPTVLNFVASGGSATIEITTYIGNWTITGNDWLSFSQTTGGTGQTTVTVTAPNYSGDRRRIGRISITDGDSTVNVSVNQWGVFSVVPNSFTFPASGGVESFTVASSRDWSITNVPAWITMSQVSGYNGTYTVTMTADTNTSSARTGSFDVSDGYSTVNCDVSQAVPNFFNIGPMSINRSSSAGTSDVLISTNGSWEITSASNWFTVAPTAGTHTSTGFTLTFNENQTAADLTGSVVVEHNETGDLYTIDVTQTSANTVGVLDMVYLVTSTTQETGLYTPYLAHNVVFMEIDGGPIQQAESGYQFSSTGLHNAKLYLNDSCVAPFTFSYREVVSANISNVDTLGYAAFQFCDELTGVTCSTITQVDVGGLDYDSNTMENPFWYCTGLTQFEGTNAILNGKGFAVGNTFVSLANGYTSFDTSILPNNITVLGGACLSPSQYTVSSVTINTNITELRRGALHSLVNATAITFNNNSIENIPPSCFAGCSKLTTLVLPDSVRTIGRDAASSCFLLSAVTFGTQLQFIDTNFNRQSDCSSLSPITNITCRSTIAPTIINNSTFFISTLCNPPYTNNYNGTVHYPAGSDYSSWQNSGPFVSSTGWTFTPDAT